MLTPPDFTPDVALEDITAAAATNAAERDADGQFPAAAFDALRALGVVAHPPVGDRQMPRLLALLAAVGRGDLSVGRIFEGHCNSLFLIHVHGSASQRAAWLGAAGEGALFGVWNTDQPGAPLRQVDGVLQGAKSFSTGIDGLDRAIITLDDGPRRQMLVVPLAELAVDRSWWKPMGMRASGSHVVDFSGLRIEAEWRLGGPGAYVGQPWFSAGAMRFAAVQVGGMHAILDLAIGHLTRIGRAADPYQAHRLAEMGIAVQSGYDWLRTAGLAWVNAAVTRDEASAANVMAVANATRCAVERLALDVLERAERSVGAAGLIAPHPLERKVRDLRTYLRQPNPDGALAAFGQAVVEGTWRPGMRLEPDG